MNIFIDPPEQHTKEQPEPLFEPRIESAANRMPTFTQLGVALGMLVVVFAASYVPQLARDRKDTPAPAVERATASEPLPIEIDHYENIDITAHAAYVWDMKNQRALYNKNASERLPLASLTKLMTILVAAEQLPPSALVPITDEALLQEGDSNFALGETFTLRDLADFTLVTSSNDGAYALAAAAGTTLTENTSAVDAFIEAMNIKAEHIGLTDTRFLNPTGLDIGSTTNGGYGSARDMAFLMEYLIERHPDLLTETREETAFIESSLGAVFTAINTNEVTNRIPGLVGSKTGFTDLAGGNLVIAFNAGLNRPIIIAVLGSTREGRFSDILELIDRTQRTLTDA